MNQLEAGIYIHVPFCKQVCPYCDFNVQALGRDDPWDALLKGYEANLADQRDFLSDHKITSIYFGGGTPSLAPKWFLEAILNWLAPIDRQERLEITLEADPGTISQAQLNELRQLGINRLSLGVQSLHSPTLKFLGRQHSSEEAWHFITSAQHAGFDNLSIDLIYAVPKRAITKHKAALERLLSHSINHISLYALTYHEGTPFFDRIKQGKLQPTPLDTEAEEYEWLVHTLQADGWERYEVSNFARPGYASVHNQHYWQANPTLGLGPGAHSFIRDTEWNQARRWRNRESIKEYLGGFYDPDWTETLSPKDLYNELLSTGLRTRRGIDWARCSSEIQSLARAQIDSEFGLTLQRQGLLEVINEKWVPSPQGMSLADSLLAGLSR